MLVEEGDDVTQLRASHRGGVPETTILLLYLASSSITLLLLL